MITFPNAKINIGLQVTERRPDGYHNLDTVFYPIPMNDALEVIVTEGADYDCRLHISGISIEGDTDNNLVVRAYRLLAADYTLPSVDIHLHKHIPTGAGLGGGSADASYMLRLLNEMFTLGLTTEQLEAYATQLGLLDDGNLLAKLRGTDGSHITSWAATYDNNIVFHNQSIFTPNYIPYSARDHPCQSKRCDTCP